MDIALPSPFGYLGGLETLSLDAFDARQQGATGELPGSEEGFIRVFRVFFSLFFLPFVYLCVNTLE